MDATIVLFQLNTLLQKGLSIYKIIRLLWDRARRIIIELENENRIMSALVENQNISNFGYRKYLNCFNHG